MKRLSLLWLAVWFGSAIASWLLSSLLPGIWGSDASFSLHHSLVPGHDAYGRNLLPLVLDASLRSSVFAFSAVAVSSCTALLGAALLSLLPSRGQSFWETPLQFMIAFPSLLFALAIGAWIGPGASTVFWALLLGTAPGLCRTLFVRAREIRSGEFIQAAIALGAPSSRIIASHLIPHLLPLLTVKLPALLIQALLAEASLSFLGLGFSSGIESWGTLLAHGRDYLIEAPGISLITGLPLFLCVWSLDVISKGLQTELR